MMWLSHTFSEDTPGYRGAATLEVRPLSSIVSGHTANSARWSFPNHSGTHIDAPAHFFPEAPSVTDYPPDWWTFTRPILVDVEAGDDQLIAPPMLEGRIDRAADLLLIRTGFEVHRGGDRYWRANPGLSPELGHWLRKHHPAVRAVGMDLISVTSFAHREVGGAAHRAFLDPTPGSPVLLIEDMALAHVGESLRQVVVAPLRVASADGAPCTVLGFEAGHGDDWQVSD